MDNESVVLINNNDLSELKLERYFALKALQANPGILENFHTFGMLVYVLNDLKPNPDVWEPPTSLMICKAVDFLNKNFNPSYSREVIEYIAFIFHNEGWVDMPEVINFAASELKALQPQDLELSEEAKEIQHFKHMAVKEYLGEK